MKRVSDAPADDDGCRVLVDRVWPRGVTKEQARVEAWLKEIAPSTELRKWFGHEASKWEEFKARYFRELDGRSGLLEQLRALPKGRRLTLLYAARDEAHNNAVALAEYLGKRS